VSSKGGPASSYATAGIALRVSGILKPPHHDKVETPTRRRSLWWRKIEDSLISMMWKNYNKTPPRKTRLQILLTTTLSDTKSETTKKIQLSKRQRINLATKYQDFFMDVELQNLKKVTLLTWIKLLNLQRMELKL
jgi:hypothetical protein